MSLGISRAFPEGVEELAGVLFPELVLNAGWAEAAVSPRGEDLPGQDGSSSGLSLTALSPSQL